MENWIKNYGKVIQDIECRLSDIVNNNVEFIRVFIKCLEFYSILSD